MGAAGWGRESRAGCVPGRRTGVAPVSILEFPADDSTSVGRLLGLALEPEPPMSETGATPVLLGWRSLGADQTDLAGVSFSGFAVGVGGCRHRYLNRRFSSCSRAPARFASTETSGVNLQPSRPSACGVAMTFASGQSWSSITISSPTFTSGVVAKKNKRSR